MVTAPELRTPAAKPLPARSVPRAADPRRATVRRVGGFGRRPAVALGAALLFGAHPGRAQAPPPPIVAEEGLRVELEFGAEADLDLFVTDPMHEEIYFANRSSRLGGRFEIDRRCGDPAPRIERVDFPVAPTGRYRISVDFPLRCRSGVDEAPYRLRLWSSRGYEEREGIARFGRLERLALEFELP